MSEVQFVNSFQPSENVTVSMQELLDLLLLKFLTFQNIKVEEKNFEKISIF